MEENKLKNNNALIIALVIIIVTMLGGFTYYITNQKPLDTANRGLQDQQVTIETDEADNDTTTPENTTPDTTTNQNTQNTNDTATNTQTKPDTSQYKLQIDKDLQSLDSLDLSSAENDFGDDKISDL